MVEIKFIDVSFSRWKTAIYDRWENFKNVQVNRRVTQAREFGGQAKEFIFNHPMISMFLAVVAVLGFIPVFLFLSIVSGSFVVIFVTALTVFQGVVVVSMVPLLTVLVPILMIGGTAAAFAYIAYCTAAKILRIVKRIFRKITNKVWAPDVLPLRINGKPVRFRSYKVRPRDTSQEYDRRYEEFPTDEEPFEEELLHSSSKRF